MIAKDLIAKITDLPAVSPAAVKILHLLSQPEHQNEDLVKALQCDPVLTAKLLRLCNTAYFSGSEPVHSLDQAVFRLGQNEMLRSVLSLSFGPGLSRSLPAYAIDARELWRHSVMTALAAQQLARDRDATEDDVSLSFTAGLLHDIGKVVLHQMLTDETQGQIRALLAAQAISRVEAEREVLQADHAEVGAWLLESWHLPGPIVEAAANHHRTPAAGQGLATQVVYLGNCVAHLLGSAPGWDGFAVRVEEAALGSFEGEQLQRVMIEVHEAMHQVERFLTVP